MVSSILEGKNCSWQETKGGSGYSSPIRQPRIGGLDGRDRKPEAHPPSCSLTEALIDFSVGSQGKWLQAGSGGSPDLVPSPQDIFELWLMLPG